MKLNGLEIEDDQLHIPSEDKRWWESYYFNFVDLRHGLSGFTTIGLMPILGIGEFIFALFYNNRRTVYFVESPTSFEPERTNPILSNGNLTYEQLSPMKKWHLSFRGDNVTADLIWEGRFLPFPFGVGSGTSWIGHFEQSGKITGVIDVDGISMPVDGLGQRDKSWGPREWHIDSWFALHAQFRNVSIGLRRDRIGQSCILSGGISKICDHLQVASMRLRTGYDDNNVPKSATSKIVGSDGRTYTLHSKFANSTSFVKFTRPFPGGRTDLFEAMAVHRCDELDEVGTGLLEWLFTRKHI